MTLRKITSSLTVALTATGFALALSMALPGGSAQAQDFDWSKNETSNAELEHAHSGYLFATPETREMQDDDFMNPAMLWVEKAESLYNEADGAAGKSCRDCHGDVSTFKGVGATYPKWDEKAGKMFNVELRINNCRTENMKADAWKYEGDEMLGMTALVKMQSRGMPINVSTSGPAEVYFNKGKEMYYERRGVMDLACVHCHIENYDMMMRAEHISQGQINGFPTYRLKWQKLGTLHRRFSGCNKNIRAEPFKRGSMEYLSLEVYTSQRAKGLMVESPSVRK